MYVVAVDVADWSQIVAWKPDWTVWALAKAEKFLIIRTQRVSNNTTTFVMSSSTTPPGSSFRPRMELHRAPTA